MLFVKEIGDAILTKTPEDFVGITMTPELSALRLADEKAYATGVRDQCKLLWRHQALRSPELSNKNRASLSRNAPKKQCNYG